MIRVAIVDEHEVFRTGLKTVFEGTAEIAVVAEGSGPSDALRLIRERPFEVLIMGLSSVGSSGIDVIRQAKRARPRIPILVLTALNDVHFANKTLKAGASGYLVKDSSAEQIIVGVRKVATGRMHVGDVIAEQLMSQIGAHHEMSGHSCLTSREFEVFLMIAKGDTCTEIARTLSLSVKTINKHKSQAMHKMKLPSVSALVQYAVAHRLVNAIAM